MFSLVFFALACTDARILEVGNGNVMEAEVFLAPQRSLSISADERDQDIEKNREFVEETSEKVISTVKIIFIVVGCLVLLGIIAGVIACVCCCSAGQKMSKRRNKRRQELNQGGQQTAATQGAVHHDQAYPPFQQGAYRTEPESAQPAGEDVHIYHPQAPQE